MNSSVMPVTFVCLLQRVLPRQLWCIGKDAVEVVRQYITGAGARETRSVHVGRWDHDDGYHYHSQQSVARHIDQI